jgi:hypothetical protein
MGLSLAVSVVGVKRLPSLFPVALGNYGPSGAKSTLMAVPNSALAPNYRRQITQLDLAVNWKPESKAP